MKDDELRRMLSDLDPMSARVPVEPVDSPQARHRLEQIMQNTEHGTDNPADSPNVVPMRRRRGATFLAAAASVAVVALGVGTVANMAGDGGHGDPAIGEEVTTVALTAPGGDSMAMCMVFDAAALRGVPMALSGTVSSIEDKTVTIDVDRWFKGGDADRVTITRPPGDISPALIPGVDFVEGKQFYLSAYDNTVNGCGFSGPATPEMKKVYDEAFPG